MDSTKEMNYKETLDFMYSQLPMFQRVGKIAFKKDLTNTLELCDFLGKPQDNIKCVHIAGTNGKGSVSHMIASILQQYGYRVGLYTSPHYKDFRERIKINAALIPQSSVIAFIEKVKPAIDTIKPSFFEITVAMAFDYFAEQNVDFAIIETGLGGRLDSTNVIKPILSVITNISFDHEDVLGDTLEKIAYEKSGIIKENIPVVIGDKTSQTRPTFEDKAKSMSAPIFYAEDEFVVELLSDANGVETFSYKSNNDLGGIVTMDYPGPYQFENIRTTLASAWLLSKSGVFEWNNSKIEQAFRNIKKSTYFLGRWEILGDKPLVIADSAHNQAGIEKVLNKLVHLHYDKMHFVLGFVNDKKLNKVLDLFPKAARYYFAKADIPRGLAAIELKEQAKDFGLHGKAYVSVKNALKAAKRAARENDLVYVGGSIFVVAEIL